MFWIIHLYIVHTIIVVQICILYYLLDSRSTRCDVFLVLINFFPFFVSKSPCERGLKKQKFFVSTTTKNRTNLHFQTRSSLRFLAALRRERNRTYTYRERKKKDASSRLRLYFFSVVSFLLFCRRWYVLRVGALDIHITFCPKGVNLKRTQKKLRSKKNGCASSPDDEAPSARWNQRELEKREQQQQRESRGGEERVRKEFSFFSPFIRILFLNVKVARDDFSFFFPFRLPCFLTKKRGTIKSPFEREREKRKEGAKISWNTHKRHYAYARIRAARILRIIR